MAILALPWLGMDNGPIQSMFKTLQLAKQRVSTAFGGVARRTIMEAVATLLLMAWKKATGQTRPSEQSLPLSLLLPWLLKAPRLI